MHHSAYSCMERLLIANHVLPNENMDMHSGDYVFCILILITKDVGRHLLRRMLPDTYYEGCFDL
jgi:hypothetical protein